ncbi:MAG: hypothetical protein QM675_03610 [Protaetiibacter sp.]
MANLTIAIDDEVLKRARLRALEQGTSVNALLRDYLSSYVGEDRNMQVRREIVESARRSRAGSGSEGRTWTRDDLYEERIGRFGA